MDVTKITFGATYCINGAFWIKPGIEGELHGESPTEGLDFAKNFIENWVKDRYPGAVISGEPEDLPVIQQKKGPCKIKADESVMESYRAGTDNKRTIMETIYDIPETSQFRYNA